MHTLAVVRALLVGIAAVWSTSCRRGTNSSDRALDGGAPRVTVSSCPSSVTPTGKGAPALANVTLTITTVPPVDTTTEATVRMEGASLRNMVRVEAAKPSQFALAPGVYVVRIGLPGYSSAEARTTLTAGCEAAISVVLRKGGK